MEEAITTFLQKVFTEYGLAVLTLVGCNAFQFWLNLRSEKKWMKLYEAEKADRKAAWKAYNELLKDINGILLKLSEGLAVIMERLR